MKKLFNELWVVLPFASGLMAIFVVITVVLSLSFSAITLGKVIATIVLAIALSFSLIVTLQSLKDVIKWYKDI